MTGREKAEAVEAALQCVRCDRCGDYYSARDQIHLCWRYMFMSYRLVVPTQPGQFVIVSGVGE